LHKKKYIIQEDLNVNYFMFLLYFKLLIKSYIALAHDSGFSITLKLADSGIKTKSTKT